MDKMSVWSMLAFITPEVEGVYPILEGSRRRIKKEEYGRRNTRRSDYYPRRSGN